DENSDIDVLIVTQKNRLWLARLLAIILMELKGVRRRPNQVTPLTHQDKFCLNMFISKESLELPRKDLFTANEFARMKTVWEKENTYQSFMQANHWIQNYLPNWKPNIKSSKFKVQSSKLSSKLKIKLPFTFKLLARFYTLIFTLCTNSLETVARIVQLNYMAKRKTTEVVTNGLLMFHPHDAREWVMKTYENRLAKLGLVDT
ncbi:MAG: hypothetical protein FJ044_03750, partial [Candidatus Cloacimonetes bacterium]|nr:hypothetical protein [Candidatus Cloacimonadota bacterium]